MNTKFYQLLAIAGWFINIAGFLLVQKNGIDGSDFLRGFGLGIVLISYLTIIIKTRHKKNEAASR